MQYQFFLIDYSFLSGKLPEKRPRSPNVSSDEDIEEPAVKGTRSSTRPKKPIIIIEPEISTDSAISSDSDARDTDPEELEILEAEEAEIRELGVNSDEESNAEVSDSKNSIILRANSGGTIPPIDDPNEIDHVWSSDDYDHDKKPEEEEDPQHQLRLLSTALANLSDTSTTTGGRRASKRKVASSAAGEGKSTPRHKRPSHERAVIPPAVIQTYLASRGIQVSLQHASRLSAGLASGSFLSPHLEQTFLHDLKKMMASSEDRKPLLTSRNSQIDPKFMSKEVKQREALQAQAMNTNSRTANPATQLFIPPTLIPVNENSREDEMLPLDAVIEMSDSGNEEDDEAGEFEEGSEPSIAAKEMPLLTTRWDRIPIGTFRRSRKISAPILKLSEAVKSNFGVVPQTIHETIFTADASDLEKLAEEDLENIYHSTKTLMRGKSEAAPRHLHLHAGAAHDCSCCYCECDECEDERAHGEEQQAVVFSSGYSSSVSSEMGTDSRSKPSKRRDSITVADLSILIHDPSNPPSTCTSPSAFRLSPTMGSIHMVDHIAMEDLHLEPATFSFPLRVPRLAVERLPETQQRSNNASATNSRRTKRRSRKISFGGTFDTILESCL